MSEQLTKSLIKKMFEKQDELNIHIKGEDWKSDKNLKWYRAIWTETAELIDYTNWKWWKQQDVNLKDVEMEVIDIWHFGLSDMMTYNNIDHCVHTVFLTFQNRFKNSLKIEIDDVQNLAESLAHWTLRNHRFNIDSFVDLCSSLNMNIEKIYKLYMGKNILNRFRQDNGYKEKNYKKEWNGQEDNFYLIKFLEKSDITDDCFDQNIYNELKRFYQSVVL